MRERRQRIEHLRVDCFPEEVMGRSVILARHAVTPMTDGLPSDCGRAVAAQRIGEECHKPPS